MAAFCFDAAITACGLLIDSALTERNKIMVNNKTEYRPRYTLHQILDENFFLPRPAPPQKVKASPTQSGLALLMALAGQPGSNVKRYEYVKPS